MKKTYVLMLLIIATLTTKAAVLIVDNNTVNPAPAKGVYTNLQTAIDKALEGDTIYVVGSDNSYGDMKVNKDNLMLIGEGSYTSGLIKNAKVGSIYLAANGIRIMGFMVVYDCWVVDLSINDILIERCEVGGTLGVKNTTNSVNQICANWVIRNNVLENVTLHHGWKNTGTNWILSNNVIQGQVFDDGNFVLANILFTNNIFLGYYANTSSVFKTCNSIILQNNIFYYKTPQGCDNCAFINNLTYKTANDSLPYGTNIGSNNFVNVNPKFVSFPSNVGFAYTYNYQLQTISPVHNSGIDGTDIGIFGGPSPAVPGAPPRIPRITNFTIPNAAIPLNGTLQINIDAKNQK